MMKQEDYNHAYSKAIAEAIESDNTVAMIESAMGLVGGMDDSKQYAAYRILEEAARKAREDASKLNSRASEESPDEQNIGSETMDPLRRELHLNAALESQDLRCVLLQIDELIVYAQDPSVADQLKILIKHATELAFRDQKSNQARTKELEKLRSHAGQALALAVRAEQEGPSDPGIYPFMYGNIIGLLYRGLDSI